MASMETLFDWCLVDLLSELEDFSVSQGTLSKYCYDGQVYVIKVRDHSIPVKRELEFLQEAADISVEVKGYIRRNKTNPEIIGFIMPFLTVIEPSNLTLDKKINIFQ